MIVLAVYAAIGLVVVTAGLLFYTRALASRRSYRCPNCNEELSVEFMKASYCNVCGSPLHDAAERDPWED